MPSPLSFVPSDNVSSSDAEILISLNTPHRPSSEYMRRMRADLPQAFPGTSFYFQNADIVNQVLNFGLSAPIDIQIQDSNSARSYVIAQKLLQGMKMIPGIADAHLVQAFNFPGSAGQCRPASRGAGRPDAERYFQQSADLAVIEFRRHTLVFPQSREQRELHGFGAGAAGEGDQRVGSDDHSDRVRWARPQRASPASRIRLLPPGEPTARLSDVADIMPVTNVQSFNHYTIQPVVDVAANIDGRDLGSIAADVRKAIAEVRKGLPSSTEIDLRGQAQTMDDSFALLAEGLVLAVFLVYALLVILFQSWIDPLIIMMAVPGALIGIVWMLALSGTTINVESLMGAIMTVGISVSNSILVVSFANDIRARDNLSPFEAVVAAGRTRLRPIMMTALAMMIGMVPMALGLGEAGEQNAPLGRAVIGGLDDCYSRDALPGADRLHAAAQEAPDASPA